MLNNSSNLIRFAAIFTSALLLSCGDNNNDSSSAQKPDNEPPIVMSTGPLASITFNETLASTSIDMNSFEVSDVNGALSGSTSYSTDSISFTPDQAFSPNVIYKATVKQSVTDLAGNPLNGDYTWFFTTTTINGREWMQPTSLGNALTWDMVNAACDASTGACNGLINGIDVSGYTWSSVNDLAEMIGVFTGGFDPIFGFHVQEANSSWAPEFLNIFPPTEVLTFRVGIFGWVREDDSNDSSSAYYGAIHNYIAPQDLDITSIGGGTFPKTTKFSAWLYREGPSSF